MINYDPLKNMYLQEQKLNIEWKVIKKYTTSTICSTSKGQNINPFKGNGKLSEQFIPVSSCLHEVPLAVANPVFLAVEEPTTKPAVKHHRLLSTT